MPKKVSFFEKLTGAVNADHDDFEDEEVYEEEELEEEDIEEESDVADAQLAVEMYQTQTDIVIQTMVAGVRPEDLNISITREMVVIEGHREGPRGIPDNDYFHKELYWGSFHRSIVLPAEIEVDEAEAVENHGLLIITLPKLNKDVKTKLKVQTK